MCVTEQYESVEVHQVQNGVLENKQSFARKGERAQKEGENNGGLD